MKKHYGNQKYHDLTEYTVKLVMKQNTDSFVNTDIQNGTHTHETILQISHEKLQQDVTKKVKENS